MRRSLRARRRIGQKGPQERHSHSALLRPRPDRQFRTEPARLQEGAERPRRHGLLLRGGRQLQRRQILRTDARTVQGRRRGRRHEGTLVALHAQPLGRGAGERRLLGVPQVVGRVHRRPQGRRHEVPRNPLDALPQIAQGVAGLLRLLQRDRQALPRERHQVRLPQPRLRIPEDRGPGDAGVHDPAHRSGERPIRDGRILGGYRPEQPGGPVPQIPRTVQDAPHQGPP